MQVAVTMAILSFAMFLLIGLMPGDPIDLAIAGDPRLSAEDAELVRRTAAHLCRRSPVPLRPSPSPPLTLL